MTTGYTAGLYDGKKETFSEFAMRCAHACGALVSMRDEPLDTPIPEEFEPSSYHVEALETAQKRLVEIESWDNARAEVEAEKDYQEALQYEGTCITSKTELRQRYESMLIQVKAWIPPTPDHEELKRFMTQQLEDSIDFDCKYIPKKLIRVSGDSYKLQKIREMERDSVYHTKEYQAEVERANGRTAWLRTLRKSLRKMEQKEES